MACMFTMMNDARLAIGLQGMAIAEAATQQAVAYARERKQGRTPGMPAEGRLACRADPRNPWTGRGMLAGFIDLNNFRGRYRGKAKGRSADVAPIGWHPFHRDSDLFRAPPSPPPLCPRCLYANARAAELAGAHRSDESGAWLEAAHDSPAEFS